MEPFLLEEEVAEVEEEVATNLLIGAPIGIAPTVHPGSSPKVPRKQSRMRVFG